jgi:uncharacterized protein with PIN domain
MRYAPAAEPKARDALNEMYMALGNDRCGVASSPISQKFLDQLTTLVSERRNQRILDAKPRIPAREILERQDCARRFRRRRWGMAEDFAHRPTWGDRIAAYPMFEALDIGSTAQLRPVPLRDPRFVIDVNLGRLARLLRVLGFDVWWSSDADDQTLADVSLGQQRILLTRDRGLLKRRAITHGLFVRSDHPEEQTLDVIRRLDLAQRLAPFTRCVRCNGRLVAVTKDEVIDHLEPLTRRYYEDFSRCTECGRIYWPGSHSARLVSFVEGLRDQL